MGRFSKGRNALMLSDRSGAAFPYKEMVQEWNGAWVHNSEYEPKQPQIDPTKMSVVECPVEGCDSTLWKERLQIRRASPITSPISLPTQFELDFSDAPIISISAF